MGSAPVRWVAMLMLGISVAAFVGRGGPAPALAAEEAVDSLWALRFTTGPGWRTEVDPSAQVGFSAHSRNLARLRAEGRILVGGRYGEVGLMVIRAGSAADVEAMLVPDSAVAAGVFKAEVSPWRTIYEGTVPRR